LNVVVDIFTHSVRVSAVAATEPSSKGIEWFGGGGWSHIDIMLDDGYYFGARSDELAGCDAGVQVRPPWYLDEAKVETQWIIEIPCTAEEHRKWYEFLEKQEGKPYDSRAIWGFVFGRDWREDDSWFCSELATAVGEYSGILARLQARVSKVNPGFCAGLYQQTAYCRGGKPSCPHAYLPVLPLAA
jgi:hypothetical protein